MIRYDKTLRNDSRRSVNAALSTIIWAISFGSLTHPQALTGTASDLEYPQISVMLTTDISARRPVEIPLSGVTHGPSISLVSSRA